MFLVNAILFYKILAFKAWPTSGSDLDVLPDRDHPYGPILMLFPKPFPAWFTTLKYGWLRAGGKYQIYKEYVKVNVCTVVFCEMHYITTM